MLTALGQKYKFEFVNSKSLSETTTTTKQLTDEFNSAQKKKPKKIIIPTKFPLITIDSTNEFLIGNIYVKKFSS